MHPPLLKYPLFLLIGLSLLLLSFMGFESESADDTEVFGRPITVRVREDAYPNYFIKNDRWQGIDVEIIRLLMEHAGLEYEFVSMPFARSLKAMEAGGVDMMPNLIKNEERSNYMDWLGPVRRYGNALIVQQANNTEQINNYNDLIAAAKRHGLKIGYTIGTSFSPDLDIRMQDASFRDSFLFVTDDATTARMLQAGRIFGFFLDEFEARNLMSKQAPAEGMNLTGLAIHPFRVPGSLTGNYIGISKHLPTETRHRLEQSMDALKQSGALEALHKKWLPF